MLKVHVEGKKDIAELKPTHEVIVLVLSDVMRSRL